MTPKATYRVVAVWWPSPAPQGFQSAANFHMLPSPLCISSAWRTRGRERQREKERDTERERGFVNSGRKEDARVSWFYLDQCRVFGGPHSTNQLDHLTLYMSHTHTHRGGRGGATTDSTCEHAAFCRYVLCILGNPPAADFLSAPEPPTECRRRQDAFNNLRLLTNAGLLLAGDTRHN